MELKIKNYYTAQETEYNGLTIVSKRCVVDKDTLSDFRKDNIVKFIFLGEDEILLSLSSNPSVNEIHKFRSKYRGGTYVSVFSCTHYGYWARRERKILHRHYCRL